MFDMGAAWRDVINLIKSQQSLVLLITGLLVFLPGLALAWFVPPPPIQPGETDIQVVMNALTTYYSDIFVWLLGVTVLAAAGTLGLFHLWVAPRAISAGAALGRSFAMTPAYLLATILSALPITVGLLMFIIPGLYLFARLSLIGPQMVARESFNPLRAMSDSWTATRGNGFRVLGFIVLVMLIAWLTYAMLSGVLGAALGAILSPDAAQWVLAPIVTLATSAITVLQCAVLAAVHRQLDSGARGDVFA